MIADNVPKHLVIGARTGFLTALGRREFPWRRVAETVTVAAGSVQLVDLGAAPMPLDEKAHAGGALQDYIEKQIELTPKGWTITVGLTQDAIDDDQTGTLERKVRAAGDNFNRHLNKLVFTTLNGGDGTTYGLCYDGQEFFDSDHVDKGGHYQTNQDNENTLALTADNFETVLVSAQNFVDDQGEYSEFLYDLLVVNPANARVAANIVGNPEMYDTANREANPYAGKFDYIVSPYLDTNAWHIIASSEPIKPIIVIMRKMPYLESAWFNPETDEGGTYFFKYRARYNVGYGDWRLAAQGQT